MMQEKAAKDLAQFNSEVKELERNTAHELNLAGFRSTKFLERMEEDSEHEVTPRKRKRFSLLRVFFFCTLIRKT